MPELGRIRGWEGRLSDVLASAEARVGPGAEPDWGTLDCATFAAGCAAALTGEDPLSGFPTWTSKREALRVLAAEGGLREAASRAFGEPIPVALAQRGDIGFSDDGELGQLGVVAGRWTLFLGDGRLTRFPTLSLDAAWPVGRPAP